MEVSSMTPNTKQTVLEPCPFCGSDSVHFTRLGTPRQSCIVECGDCGARLEANEEGQDCGNAWNSRAEPASHPWPSKPTPAMIGAMRVGSRKDYPSDELCRVRYAALRSAALTVTATGKTGIPVSEKNQALSSDERAAVRNAALDEAAAVAKRISDKYAYGYYGQPADAADEIEREIRALKSVVPPTPQPAPTGIVADEHC
ncbi:restriction alleviation protein, Lar family [Bordetella avium]|nr:restriction alleviation protein, Lar family [Bordetella avium]RIQ16279.1 restriction alleviation protein, Lar family [Bordetella avium]RIQ58453.1 restriction alleviation protein, Lar family [Bordetella avium]RIQ58923.1 restriction alleviation protein, Lar family [Bordetella avium]RIQ77270.1 restriction alleviation protein, Lar family [Bordetella avium]